jgi:hypothetical protein
MRHTYIVSTLVCSMIVSATTLMLFPPSAAAVDVLTQHNDRGRTGANLMETKLNTSTVNAQRFGKLWTLYADGQITAQPLYVSGLQIDTTNNPDTPLVKGTFNAVVVATMHNTIYVYDADKEKPGPNGQTVPLWAKWLGQPRPGGADIDMYHTNDPEWGILSTPVIDDAKKTLYAVAWHDAGGGKYEYRVHALNLGDGTDRAAAVTISGSVPKPSGGQPVTFDSRPQKQRAALLLNKDVLYIGFGGGFHGWLFAYDAKTLDQRGVWCTTPTGDQGGVWMGGQGPAADADGNVYVMTGNGTFDVHQGGQSYGDSFVKLTLDNGKFVVKDYFSPCNQKFLQQMDIDVGSAGPLLIPAQDMIVGGGKQGRLFLLFKNNMGKHVANLQHNDCHNPNIPQELDANAYNAARAPHIHGSPIFWKGPDTGRIYVWNEFSPLKAFKFANRRFQEIATPKTSVWRPPDGMPGGMLSLSSNGSKAGTGILWALVPLTGDANQFRGVKGVLIAFDAQDVSKQLWRSDQTEDDAPGLFAKFVPPTIADGKVFVATYGNEEPQRRYQNEAPQQFPSRYSVAVYGLLENPRYQVLDQNTDDITVVKAGVTSDVHVDVAKCTTVNPHSIDCTGQFEQSHGAPSLHQILVPAGYNFDGCKAFTVTTASKKDGLKNAAAAGFWSMDATDGFQGASSEQSFTRDALTKNEVGPATFKNGAAAVLHQFVGMTNCVMGPTNAYRQFKPFMDFRSDPDKRIYRNWDLANNYTISGAVTEFDRSAEILKP